MARTKKTKHRGLNAQFAAMKMDSEQLYELMNTAMESNTRTRLAGPAGADGNYHIQNQNAYQHSVSFARALEANNPAVSAALNRLVMAVNVGQMTPVPNTGSDTLNEHLSGKWNEDYKNNPDVCCSQGRFTYEQQADITFRRVITDGDLFPVVNADNPLTVKHMESHRCQTPYRSKTDRGVCGIQKTGDRVTHFWLTSQSLPYRHGAVLKDYPFKGKHGTPVYTQDGWKQATQIFNPKLFSIDRGFTALGAVGTTESRRDDLEFARVVKEQVASCVTFVQKATQNDQMLKQLLQDGLLPSADTNDDVQPTSFETDGAGFEFAVADIQPGRVLRPKLGFDLEMLTPTITTDGQLGLNLLLLQYLAISLDLPLAMLLLDVARGSFSTVRVIMDLARDAFLKHQSWFGNQYHAFRWRNWIKASIPTDSMLANFRKTEGDVSLLESKILRHTWQGKAFRHYHPVDDAAGDLIQISKSLKSYDKFARERYGITGDQLSTQIIEGNFRIYEKVLEKVVLLRKKFGDKIPNLVVNEQLLFSHPAMTNMSFSLSRTQDSDQPTQASTEGGDA